jgi:hypothetical protein
MHLIKTQNQVTTIGRGMAIESNCIAITFLNKTTSNSVVVNGVLVIAGEQYKVEQSSGYFDTTKYDVIFLSGLGVNELVISKIVIVK